MTLELQKKKDLINLLTFIRFARFSDVTLLVEIHKWTNLLLLFESDLKLISEVSHLGWPKEIKIFIPGISTKTYTLNSFEDRQIFIYECWAGLAAFYDAQGYTILSKQTKKLVATRYKYV